MTPAALVFLFVDGVGIGPPDRDRNPFMSAALDGLDACLGGARPTTATPRVQGRGGFTFPLDANLETAGRPQSGTGQTSLLTGINAAERFGRHFGPWTPVRLRPLLGERNLLRLSRDAGLRVAFANAYPDGYLERVPSRRVAAPPLAADSAGLLVRNHLDLRRGEAVASGILNHGWQNDLGFDVPSVNAEAAGANLARIAAANDLTLFAHYDTDRAGHEGTLEAGVRALDRVDGLIRGLIGALPKHGVVLVASDHGNIEEADGKHTRNPVLGALLGPDGSDRPAAFAEGRRLASIVDVAPAVSGYLEDWRRG